MMKRHAAIQVNINTGTFEVDPDATRQYVAEIVEQMRAACREIAELIGDQEGWIISVS